MSNAVVGALRVVLGIDSAAFESGVTRSTGALGKFDVATKRSAKNVEALDEASSQSTHGMKMMAYQLNQVGQQGAVTGNYMQALMIQIPDMAASFGFLGAMIGSVAAFALPSIVAAFTNQSSAAEDAQKAVDALTSALGTYRGAVDAVNVSMPDLAMQFGNNADEVLGIRRMQADLARMQADRAFGSAVRGLSGAIGGDVLGFSPEELARNAEALARVRAESDALAVAMQNLGELGNANAVAQYEALMAREAANDLAARSLTDYTQAIRGLAANFSISEQAAADLAVQVAKVSAADTTEERLAAAEALAQAIYDSTNGLRDASNEAVSLHGALLDAVAKGYEFQAIDLASGITAGADEAGRLARNLELARAASLNYGKIQNAGDSGPDAARRAVLGLNAPGPLTGTVASGAGGVYIAPASGGGGGRGGGGGGANREEVALQREAARVYEQTRTAAERMAKELERLNTLKSAGLIDSETYTRAVDRLGESLGDVAGVASELQGDFRSLFTDIVTGSSTADEALKRFFSNIAGRLANSAFDTLWGSIFGRPNLAGGGGKSGGLFGGLFGFADGGSFEVGGVGGVDSQIVAFRASPDERVTITKPGQGFSANGPAGIDVRVVVESSEDLRVVARTEGRSGGAEAAAGYAARAQQQQRRG